MAIREPTSNERRSGAPSSAGLGSRQPVISQDSAAAPASAPMIDGRTAPMPACGRVTPRPHRSCRIRRFRRTRMRMSRTASAPMTAAKTASRMNVPMISAVLSWVPKTDTANVLDRQRYVVDDDVADRDDRRASAGRRTPRSVRRAPSGYRRGRDAGHGTEPSRSRLSTTATVTKSYRFGCEIKARKRSLRSPKPILRQPTRALVNQSRLTGSVGCPVVPCSRSSIRSASGRPHPECETAAREVRERPFRTAK